MKETETSFSKNEKELNATTPTATNEHRLESITEKKTSVGSISISLSTLPPHF